MNNTIMLCSSSVTVQKVVKWSLSGKGYIIKETKDVVEAKELIKNQTIDLMLVDQDLAKGGGFSFCEYVKSSKDYNKIPVVLLMRKGNSGNVKDDKSSIIKKCKADGTLRVPFESNELEKIVADFFDLEAEVSEEEILVKEGQDTVEHDKDMSVDIEDGQREGIEEMDTMSNAEATKDDEIVPGMESETEEGFSLDLESAKQAISFEDKYGVKVEPLVTECNDELIKGQGTDKSKENGVEIQFELGQLDRLEGDEIPLPDDIEDKSIKKDIKEDFKGMDKTISKDQGRVQDEETREVFEIEGEDKRDTQDDRLGPPMEDKWEGDKEKEREREPETYLHGKHVELEDSSGLDNAMAVWVKGVVRREIKDIIENMLPGLTKEIIQEHLCKMIDQETLDKISSQNREFIVKMMQESAPEIIKEVTEDTVPEITEKIIKEEIKRLTDE